MLVASVREARVGKARRSPFNSRCCRAQAEPKTEVRRAVNLEGAALQFWNQSSRCG